jgi:predicted Zn-dependent protease
MKGASMSRLAKPFTPLLLGLIMLITALPLRAASLIRDAEIERALSELAAPVITAAGLNPQSIQVMILNDRSLNAFIVDTRRVFIHSGLLLKLKRPEMVQAVIAHELAHISNGHITRRRANERSSKTTAGLGLLLGAAATASGAGAAGLGLAAGAAGAAERNFLANTRAEEASADQSALRYMATAGVDPSAMAEVLDLFRGQEVLNIGRQDPYIRSHPLTRDRLRSVDAYVAAYQDRARAPSGSTLYWYARLQAKLGAFLGNPQRSLRKIPQSDQSEIALLTRAVAYHRLPDHSKAMAAMNALVNLRPKDPYYHELRGQILLESQQPQAAVAAYQAAVRLAPSQALILAGLGRAQLAAGQTKAALATLEKARARDGADPRMLRDLAVAYAKTGNTPMASLATAERYALLGKSKDAALHAQRAADQLPRGSPGWLRAMDIVDSVP